MRSYQLYEFNTKISEINTNLSYFIFYTNQFISDNELAIQKLPEEFTSSFFEYNKYKDQFNIKLKGIPDQVEKYKGFIFDSLFINAYFYFEIYLKDCFEFVLENNLYNNLSDIGDTGILDNINQKFNAYVDVSKTIFTVTGKTIGKLQNHNKKIPQATIDKIKPILYIDFAGDTLFSKRLSELLTADEFIKYEQIIINQSKYFFNYFEIRTMDYIRERRNAIVHSKEKLSEQVESVIDSDSTKLQNYWNEYNYFRKDANSKPKFKVENLNFSNKELDFKSEHELIEIFNLLRIIAKNIDNKILQSANEDLIDKYLISSYKSQYQHETNKRKFSRFFTKFSTFSKILLDKKYSEDKIKEIFNGEVAQW